MHIFSSQKEWVSSKITVLGIITSLCFPIPPKELSKETLSALKDGNIREYPRVMTKSDCRGLIFSRATF